VKSIKQHLLHAILTAIAPVAPLAAGTAWATIPGADGGDQQAHRGLPGPPGPAGLLRRAFGIGLLSLLWVAAASAETISYQVRGSDVLFQGVTPAPCGFYQIFLEATDILVHNTGGPPDQPVTFFAADVTRWNFCEFSITSTDATAIIPQGSIMVGLDTATINISSPATYCSFFGCTAASYQFTGTMVAGEDSFGVTSTRSVAPNNTYYHTHGVATSHAASLKATINATPFPTITLDIPFSPDEQGIDFQTFHSGELTVMRP